MHKIEQPLFDLKPRPFAVIECIALLKRLGKTH
jgi:hypothetical protein